MAIRLRQLRIKKGLTQKELGDILRVSESAIGMYERGERRPSIDLINTMADYFDVETDYLTGKKNTTQIYSSNSIPVELIQLKEFAEKYNLDLTNHEDFELIKKSIEIVALARKQ